MKKNTILLYFSSLLVLMACSKDEVESKPDTEITKPDLADTFKYIAISGTGYAQLYEIGNNSGNVTKLDKIPGLEYNLVPTAITSSKKHHYFYQQVFDPLIGKIFVYDKITEQTEVIDLNLSDSFGQFATLSSLDWDDQNQRLVGIVCDDYLAQNKTNSLVSIDAETFEVEALGIEFIQDNINSVSLKDGILYVSSFSNAPVNDFNKIDITAKTVERIVFKDDSFIFTGLSINDTDSTMFAFHPLNLPGYACSGPSLIDLKTFDVQPIETDELSCIPFDVGNSYFNTMEKEYVAVVNLTGQNPNPNAILRFDVNTKKARLVVLNDKEGITNSILLIDTIAL